MQALVFHLWRSQRALGHLSAARRLLPLALFNATMTVAAEIPLVSWDRTMQVPVGIIVVV